MEPNRSRWAGRFIGAAIIQGAIAFAILGVLIGISALQLNPSPGRIVAGGDTCSVTITNQTAGTGAALLPVSSGGLGKNAFYVHTNILNPLAPYITALLGIALLGFFLGGVGYVTAWWSARKKTASA